MGIVFNRAVVDGKGTSPAGSPAIQNKCNERRAGDIVQRMRIGFGHRCFGQVD